MRVKPDAAADSVLRVCGATGVRLLAPKPMDFEGFSYVAGMDATQDDIMTREWAAAGWRWWSRYTGAVGERGCSKKNVDKDLKRSSNDNAIKRTHTRTQ